MNMSVHPVRPQVPALSAFPVAAKVAWREVRGGLGALKLLFACLFLGVLAMAAVGSLSASIGAGLASEGQSILGGDIEVRLAQRSPDAAELAALQQMGPVSQTVRMRAMVRGESGAATGRQLLAELKAVDAAWPLYGEAALSTGGGSAAVQAALARGAVVGSALAEQLNLKLGDNVSVGDANLPVTGILAVEPDRASEGFALGPSILVAMDRMPATGLIQPGSLYRHHTRVKLPLGADLDQAKAQLEHRFPEAGWRIGDRRDGAPGVRRFVDRVAQFLSLVSLAAMAVAGVGVGNGVAAYLERKGGTIATLKAMGASSRLIIMAYLLLVGGVALLASVVGAIAGAFVPWFVVMLVGDAFPVPPVLGLHIWPLLLAISLGLLVATAFAVPPLARAGALPAQRMFRGSVEHWPWPSKRALAVSGVAGLLVAALAILTSPEPLFGLAFVGGTLVVIALLWGVGSLVVALAKRMPRPKRVLPRLALSNLYRPGAMTRPLVVALGLGLSLFATLSFVETSFNAEMQKVLPARAPGFFVLDLPREDEARFRASLPEGSDVMMVPSLRGPVTAVNGVPASELRNTSEGAWILRGDRGLTWSATVPPGNKVVAGEWWPEDYSGPPLVSMDVEQAGLLGLKPGDHITVSVLGVEIEAKIQSLREIQWDDLGFNFAMIFDPSTLREAPFSYMATVSPPAAAEAGFTGAISRAFPTASVVRVKDVLGQLGDLVSQMGLAVRAASAVAILAGIAVLVGALQAQARTRIMDNVILKTLGATRRQLMGAAALEYAGLGLLVALAALLLGGICGWVVIRLLFEFTWQPDYLAAILTVLAGALVTLILGLAGAWRLLGNHVAPALREL